MGGHINFRWVPFDLKLKVIVPFLRVNSGFESNQPPSTLLALIISPKTSNQNLEIANLFIVVEES